jgi:hypothetical protein
VTKHPSCQSFQRLTVTEVVVVAGIFTTAVQVVLVVGTERHLQAELRA